MKKGAKAAPEPEPVVEVNFSRHLIVIERTRNPLIRIRSF